MSAPTITDGERMRMLLAEAGYPNAKVSWAEDHESPEVDHDYVGDGEWDPPDVVVWRAFRILYPDSTPECFECWRGPWSTTCEEHPIRVEEGA